MSTVAIAKFFKTVSGFSQTQEKHQAAKQWEKMKKTNIHANTSFAAIIKNGVLTK